MTTTHLGQPVNRVDGRAKVTGAATYAAEFAAENLAYGCVVSSTVARGQIAAIDTAEALAFPGVLHVFTHENAPRPARSAKSYTDEVAPNGTPFRPLRDAEIRWDGQPVALVVAETFEAARHAAGLVRVDYAQEAHTTDLERERHAAYEPEHRTPPPEPRGDAKAALAKAPVRIEAEYRTPFEHHNPMELFGTTVEYHADGTLTVYDKTQGVGNVHEYLCRVFGYKKNQVRVRSPFVGGAFGSGLRPHYHVFLAVVAARELRRSVRVSLTRQQMWSLGHRPATWQRVRLGADVDGTLQALTHEAIAETSRFEDFNEAVVNWSGVLYRCPNIALDHQLVKLDVFTPMDMRAPGATWGVYALECAMDELAVATGVDPLELRLRNYADRDQAEDKPFSSKELRECYRLGAERFGWYRRTPEPRSMRADSALIGWGMATGVWEAMQETASARAVLDADGTLVVSSATADIGPGTYTVMTQIAAETLGLPLDRVTFTLGDSSLPKAPVEGGSFTVASVGTAVKAACEKVGRRLRVLAREHGESVPIAELMRAAGLTTIEETAAAKPSKKHEEYALYTHSAVFAEVQVDEELGTIRVTRVVSAVAAGRILNPKTARSQIVGGIVWGIGMALQEHSVMDHALGRFVTHNLAEYHVPVNADVHAIDVIFVDEHDDVVNPLGVKGVGEIGLVGVGAAIANAVYHATGKRVRDLPITLDTLL